MDQSTEGANPEADKKGVMQWNVPKPVASLHKMPEPKRRFMASKNERNIVNKLVHAIKQGWLDLDAKREKRKEEERKLKREFDEAEFVEEMGGVGDVWGQSDGKHRGLDPLVAPGFELPDHVDSFNPAPEFLEDVRQCKFFWILWVFCGCYWIFCVLNLGFLIMI